MAKYKNKVEAIIFSDLHITKYTKFNQGDRRTKNALDVLRTVRLVTKRHKTVSLFLGDLLHKEKAITNELLDKILPFFSRLWSKGNFITYAITGNHDQSSFNSVKNESPSYIRTLSKTFPGMICMDFQVQKFKTWDLYGIPYLTHDLGLIESAKKFNLDSKKVNVLMIHTTMPGAKDTDNRVMNSNIKQSEFSKVMGMFDIVLCGHIHKPEMYDIGKTRIIQVGAPQQQRATDKNCDMGYWIMYDNFEFEFVHLSKYPKFIEIEKNKKLPDSHNFYIFKKPKKEENKVVTVNNFSNIHGSELAKKYTKVKKIKSKKRLKALENSLNNVL